VLGLSPPRSAWAPWAAPSGPELAAEALTTGHDPYSVARFRQPVLATAQRVLLPLAVASTGATG